MTVTTILLLFHVLTSSTEGMNPFSGCLHYLEASQMIYDADRLTSFSAMGTSIEKSFRAICKIIFFVNRILLLLSVLSLALIFLISMVYLVFFTFYCFSNLVCANLVGKGFGRFACFESYRPLLTQFHGLYSCFWPFFCWLERHFFKKMPVNLIHYHGTVEFSTANILFLI